MSEIVLVGINARFSHTAFGLRFLLANLHELQSRTQLIEFNLDPTPAAMAEELLQHHPRIIGIGVYVWNIDLVNRLVRLLKQLQPHIWLVVGGPQTISSVENAVFFPWVDYVIQAEAEIAFYDLCQNLLTATPPQNKIIAPPLVDLPNLASPYDCYSDEDIAKKFIYVESSRGCPYQCAFCLSALDKKIRYFPLEPFLEQMQTLWQRGVRHFKMVDRAFNLHDQRATHILDFFLGKANQGLFLHIEMVPDRLSDAIKQRLLAFPAGTLQLEIGIQSLDDQILHQIGRKQNIAKSLLHLAWLLTSTHAHIHTDLIVGLPGESLAGFAQGFDRLIALQPHEIQVGILKRIPGTPLCDMEQKYQMIFNPDSPYELLCNDQISFMEMRQMTRFARYWDLVANSGRFHHYCKWLFRSHSPFATFWQLAQWLYTTTRQTHTIALARLFDLLGQGAITALGEDPQQIAAILALDHALAFPTRHLGAKSTPLPRQGRHLPPSAP